MRPLKFRVWDKENKRMLFSSEPKEQSGREYVPFVFGIGWSDWEAAQLSELMQYTGLLDKHGKEVYEGDIVRINHPQDITGDFTNAIGEVLWWEEEGGFYHGNNHGRPPKRMWNYVEVIGNIYQHPDLREGGKS